MASSVASAVAWNSGVVASPATAAADELAVERQPGHEDLVAGLRDRALDEPLDHQVVGVAGGRG